MSKIQVDQISTSKIAIQSPIQFIVALSESLIHAKNVDDVFAQIITEIKSLLNTAEVVIYCLDRKTEKPVKKYHRIGKTGNLNLTKVKKFEQQHFLILEAIGGHKPAIVFSNPENSEFAILDSPIECQMAIPIMYHDQLHSVLFVRFKSVQDDKKDWINLAKAISYTLSLHLTRLEEQEFTQIFKDRVRKIIVSKVSELEIALNKADKYNQSLKDFSYIVSHDLREPLRTINSYIKLLDRRYKDKFDEDALVFMNFVTDGVQRMDALIKDLLVFSRIENSVYQFEETNLENILVLTQNNLKLKLEESGAIIKSDRLPTLWASRSHLSILFQNLIDNAIKFSSPKRSLIIGIKVSETKTHWQFEIKDNGIGMDLEHKNNERIFKIFQRLQSFDSKIPGTGIGLAICKNIVLAHGGNIWVNSKPGKGSTFHFTISKSLRPI